MEKQKLFTLREVCKILSVSKFKLYEFINDVDNPLPVFKLSERGTRVRENDLWEWLEKQQGLVS